jgi:hypothetical protein
MADDSIPVTRHVFSTDNNHLEKIDVIEMFINNNIFKLRVSQDENKKVQNTAADIAEAHKRLGPL